MYDAIEQFQNDAMLCGPAHYPDASLAPANVAVAFRIYSRTRQGTTLLDADGNPVVFGVTIVGRLANGRAADETYPCIDELLKENLKTLSEDPAEVTGSILETGSWSLLANEAWVLGGLHAETEFHFASPLRWSNLWDASRDRMTVTGRELLGIVAHGYEIRHPNPKLEQVAIC